MQPTKNVIVVHDAVRNMAINIGETSVEKCVFRVGQMFQQFPDTRIHDYKLLSVLGSNIRFLPAIESGCQNLMTLFLKKLELK